MLGWLSTKPRLVTYPQQIEGSYIYGLKHKRKLGGG